MHSDAKTLRTAIIAWIHSATEYCASTSTLALLTSPSIHLVTGCLCPTPVDNLFVLAGSPKKALSFAEKSAELRRKRATLPLACHAMNSEHLLHDRLLFTPTTQQRELKSRHPFVPAALELLKDLDKSTGAWLSG